MSAAPPSTRAAPIFSLTGSRTVPSRKAAAMPARNTVLTRTTRRRSTEDSVAATSQSAAGAPKGEESAPEQQEHEQRDGRHRERGMGLRRPQRVLHERDLEGRHERAHRDEAVEAVATDEVPDAGH